MRFFKFFAIFFRIFLPSSSMNRSRDENFFHSFSAYLIPIWLKRRLERGFLIFWIFLLFFSEFSCPGRLWKEFRTKIFLSFPAYLSPFWLKFIPEKGFLIFCDFFQNFLARVEYERNSELKFLPFFLGLSHPLLAKNNARKRFFHFLNFFAIFFFGIFFPGSSMNGIRD